MQRLATLVCTGIQRAALLCDRSAVVRPMSQYRWRLFDDIGTDLACHPVLVADGAAAADRADHFQLLLLKGQDIQ
jgi:hypothetical protein